MNKALELTGGYMGQRYLTVSLAQKERKPRGMISESLRGETSKVFVKNIPYSTDESAMKRVFQKFGTVVDVRIPRHTDTGRIKGSAYVEFSESSGASAAVDAASVTLGGRDLFVDFEGGSARASFRDRDGRYYYKGGDGRGRGGRGVRGRGRGRGSFRGRGGFKRQRY